MEYQTYGNVEPELQTGQKQFYWEDSSKEKAIKIVYDSESGAVRGVNLFGLRHRHEVWDKWLRMESPIEYVVDQLDRANFDPEFSRRYEKEIRKQFRVSSL